MLAVVNDKGKLAIDLVKEIHPMLFVQVQQDFNIRVGAKAMALLDQYFFQLEIVEDLAIAHQHHGPVFVVDRLVATLQIDNAQTPKAQRHTDGRQNIRQSRGHDGPACQSCAPTALDPVCAHSAYQ